MTGGAATGGLTLTGLTKRFGAFVAVDDIDLEIRRGEFLTLLGPSGSGKTTLLMMIAGFLDASDGDILLDGASIRNLPAEKRNFGMVFQGYALFPHMTARQNIAYPLDVRKRPKAEIDARVDEMLDLVQLSEFGHRKPVQLSGGQQQRVALARALAPQPALLLLDEAFSDLDARLRDQVRDDTLHILKETGTAALMVTHDAEEAMYLADRIAIMNEGELVQIGTPHDIYFHPGSSFVASFFSDVNIMAGKARGGVVPTPLGDVPTEVPDGTPVDVVVRPEGLLIRQKDVDVHQNAEVVATRLLGRTSLIHLSVSRNGEAPLHLHARRAGVFLPDDFDRISIDLDLTQTFVFPHKTIT